MKSFCLNPSVIVAALEMAIKEELEVIYKSCPDDFASRENSASRIRLYKIEIDTLQGVSDGTIVSCEYDETTEVEPF